MTHPIIPEIIALATPIAQQIGLEIVDIVFLTNRRPPILRVDIRNPKDNTGIDDCEKMSRVLEPILDESNLIPDSYVLEVASPGISRILSTDREFTVFKGFDVIIKAETPYQNQKEWRGKLQGRDEEMVYLNRKGKSISLPREIIAKVQLDDQA